MDEPRYNKNRCEHGLRDVEGESQVEERKLKERGGMRRHFGKTLEVLNGSSTCSPYLLRFVIGTELEAVKLMLQIKTAINIRLLA